MLSIDRKDAYFQIPAHPESRLYLLFIVLGKVYQSRVPCFGLSTAPQIFTKVFALVSEWAHRRGSRLLRYLDDWLVVAEFVPLLLRTASGATPPALLGPEDCHQQVYHHLRDQMA